MGNLTSKNTNEYELINGTADTIEDIKNEQIIKKAKRKHDMIRDKLFYFNDKILITIVYDNECEDNFQIIFTLYVELFNSDHIIGYFYTPHEALEEYFNMVGRVKGEVKNMDIGSKYFNCLLKSRRDFIEEIKTAWDNFE
jgi:hypothetical protein